MSVALWKISEGLSFRNCKMEIIVPYRLAARQREIEVINIGIRMLGVRR